MDFFNLGQNSSENIRPDFGRFLEDLNKSIYVFKYANKNIQSKKKTPSREE